MTRSLSASQARRIALAAQGLAASRPARPVTARAFRALAERLAVLQLDSVNVMVRTHYMPAFSRLGPYPPALLEDEAWGRRPSLFEYWGHVACLMPVEMQPLFRWRMAQARANDRTGGLAEFGRERADYIASVLEEIRVRGPVTGGDFAGEGPRKAGWWSWSDGKLALEWLFYAGLITTRTRRAFERVYDLTERVIPPAILAQPTPSKADAHRELVRIAAQAMGVATVADLADYFRILQGEAKARADELVEQGVLEKVAVDAWRGHTYMAVGARMPRRATGAALLSPFDNMIWRRERTERMFGLRYRIGIYTPADQREHGYYVYPFLMDDALAARVDLKADRAAGKLLVQAAHLEPGADAAETARRLAAELAAAAAWQGLAEVAVMKKGGLATALSREIG
ncbi:MAG TPA: crosslink repair DNA glycosylase YcaQ family protein [Caulobacteraceae bacterium]|nr:crosslink repair DNA glycosylase YcaQ family protein [Caulobacteraceae bacterium]